MCSTCGCGGHEAAIGTPWRRSKAQAGRAAWSARRGEANEGAPARAAGSVQAVEGHAVADADAPGGPASGPSVSEIVRVERDLLGRNDAIARGNRDWFAAHGVLALNFVSSPGSGKTSLLVRSIEALAGRVPVAVIEGDQQTELDAERIRATGAAALQINTGKGCHLDADMIRRALARMALADDSLLLIENVGNLVCPAAFDLGEAHKVVILSVTEGEDKPLKYPDMFAAADLMLLNKTDLLPYVDFDVARAVDLARRVNPRLACLPVSARTGAGLDDWLAWVLARCRGVGHRPDGLTE
ncbi:MAG: hydrogenase nickel incorporation protein HypB [Rhodocyclaceae bacterium]